MTELRLQLIDTARRMAGAGLNRGTAGNVSVRASDGDGGGEGFLITPTGMAYDALASEDVVFMRLDGSTEGRRKPSSEWRFHRDLYLDRADAGAIVHAHSPFATSLACLRREIPPFHYMIARFGGDNLRCAAYATFGTQALSDAVLQAIAGRRACLLANHGMLVFGDDLGQTFDLAVELETLCEQYWRSCQLGEPVLLDAAEMRKVLARFGSYGQQA
ncbi:MAG: class II aldolase/adducin family protein [Candidatus Accumulibacter sp.]|uniref:class II aldolase/adducin family protein n=1 Tax=Accumulibacter sp. TaxID=2053492 RepID=UPI0025D1723B|nr:class II aldolase/adducin family protein [Accumulibacter sp.]MCP5247817.1 class II aldolase/adducin family protein [Accumulibacter sp.]